MSLMSQCRVLPMEQLRSVASTEPLTAVRTGIRSSSLMRTRAVQTSLWTTIILEYSMQVCGITDACHGKFEVVGQAQAYISLLMAVTPGHYWKMGCRKAWVK